jgi:hypothetical protein
MGRFTRAVVVAALALSVAGPALAAQNRVQRKRGTAAGQPQTPETRPERQRQFKKLDLDGNGSISRQEWKGKPKAFDRLDANHDGQLTPAELQRRPRARASRR